MRGLQDTEMFIAIQNYLQNIKATYQYNSSEMETQTWATVIYMNFFFSFEE